MSFIYQNIGGNNSNNNSFNILLLADESTYFDYVHILNTSTIINGVTINHLSSAILYKLQSNDGLTDYIIQNQVNSIINSIQSSNTRIVIFEPNDTYI